MFFKDDPAVINALLPPSSPIAVAGTPLQQRIAATYNRIGGLLTILAQKANIPIEGALAVWQVESGGEAHIPGKPILRFENHHFYRCWGKQNVATFDKHFQYGGHAGMPGSSWKNHRWRSNSTGPWETFHGSQGREYSVFAFADTLSGAEPACLSCSFGGPQILGSNHDMVGYNSAKAMFDAMVLSELGEVCSFFDYCKSKKILDEVRDDEWEEFARGYNGDGQAAAYGQKIESCFHAAVQLPIPSSVGASAAITLPQTPVAGPVAAVVNPPTATDASDQMDFVAFFTGLGLKHFKPYELLTMGHQHSDPSSPAYGLNTSPPRSLWPNIVETVKVLDELRDLVGAAITISSAYRSPAYNKAIAGAGGSQHMKFNALDFSVRSVSNPADWAAALKQLRANGRFKGGIGVYSTFVHVDTRGSNADW
ncbi:N-acetylmuramidase domain-containing protein [Agrobacterium vitis]